MFEAEYARRRTTAEAEAGRICSGDTVYLAGGPLLPVDFAAALHRRAAELHGGRGLNYLPLESLALLTDPACGDAFQIESIFYNTYQQEAQRLGRCAFLPNHLRNAARDWTHGAPEYDCLVLTVSPMDKHGCFSLAGSACIELEVLPRARRVVVEVASRAPRIFGDVTLHVSQVDAIVESDRYPAALSPQPPDEVDRQLGRVVAELVEDGATIQLGFGGTINALAAELKDKRGLGIHTEAMSDAAMELLRCGAADNSRKSLHRGKTVTCFTMGSHALYDFVDDNPTILHKALSYTNDLSVLAANRGMTSINAALQVDLTGQCASESVGPRQISGSGGQVDTAVGAQMAPGGKSVITLRSTYSAKDPATGERIMAVSSPMIYSSGEVIGVLRYVTSMKVVNRQLGFVTLVALAGNFILSLLPDSIIAALNYLLPALFGAMCMQRIMMDYKSAFVLLPCALIIRYLSTLGVFKVLPFGGGYAPILSCVIIGVVVAKALHGKAAAKPKA